VALLRSALQAWCGHRGSGAGFGAWCDPEGLVLLVRLARVCDTGLKGRFPVAQGAALGDRGPKKIGFLGLKGRFQGDCGCAVMHGVPGAYARGSAETGPSGVVGVLGASFIHNFTAGNARGTWVRAPEAVPEFTANTFADHHRRIRAASLCQPKTMNSLRGSSGNPSTTPQFAVNDNR